MSATKLINSPLSALGEAARNPHVGKPGMRPTPQATGITSNLHGEAGKLSPELQRKLNDVVVRKRMGV